MDNQHHAHQSLLLSFHTFEGVNLIFDETASYIRITNLNILFYARSI